MFKQPTMKQKTSVAHRLRSVCGWNCRKGRRGLSLLELMLGLLILAVAISALGNLAYTGLQASLRSQWLAESSWRAVSLLDELAAEIRQATSVPTVEALDDRWFCEYRRIPTELNGIDRLEVKVWKAGRDAQNSELSLQRLVFHPTRRQ